MTVYILSNNQSQALKAEIELVNSVRDVEVNNIFHHDAYIYYAQNAQKIGENKAKSLVKRAAVMLICQSDAVLVLQEDKNFMPLFDILGISVFAKVSDFSMKTDPSKETKDYTSAVQNGKQIMIPPGTELLCEGCPVSKDSPVYISGCSDYKHRGCQLFLNAYDAYLGDSSRALVLTEETIVD